MGTDYGTPGGVVPFNPDRHWVVRIDGVRAGSIKPRGAQLSAHRVLAGGCAEELVGFAPTLRAAVSLVTREPEPVFAVLDGAGISRDCFGVEVLCPSS